MVRILVFLLGFTIGTNLFAQKADTLNFSLKDAEKQFLDSNLLLIAQKYNIDEKAALITQSKIWDLPNVTVEKGAYQTQTKKWFESGVNGELSSQLQQLILIAGKRNKMISMAKENNLMARSQFMDVLRTLKYQLRSTFYSLFYLQQSNKVFTKEIDMLAAIVDKYETLYKDGYIALKDLVRLKSLLLSLQSEQLQTLNDIQAKQADLRVLLKLGKNVYVNPKEVEAPLVYNFNNLNLSAMLDSAASNRGDLQMASHMLNYSNFDLSYQKALSKPDLQLIAGFDKTGSYIPNYNYVGLSFDLPFWNRNKGNIKAASARMNEAQAQFQNFAQTVINDVTSSYRKALETENLYKNFNNNFLEQFNKLIEGANDSFIKHELNLMEFVDLYESYKNTYKDFYDLQLTYLLSKEDLNYNIGKDIVK
jgi:outer membrane protein, heavy metal efflux system